MTIAGVRHSTTTVTTFTVPDRPVVDLQRGAQKLRVRIYAMEVQQFHGASGREVYISGPFLKADDTEGTWRKHHLVIVPTEVAVLVDEACAGVAL